MKAKPVYHGGTRFAAALGFTLIELAISLVVLGLIAVLILELFPALTDRMRLDQAEVDMGDVDEAVNGFALANNRLPCPDADGDGFEGCGDAVGLVPYRTVGLPGPALDEARRPLRYGVYRNPDAEADLASLQELFEPALPDALDITAGTVTGCNETIDPPQTIIIYDLPPATTLTVDPISGSFQDEEYVGFTLLELSNITADPVPEPLDSPLDPGEEFFCPCGAQGMSPNAECLTCPANFGDGKFSAVLESQGGLQGHLLTSDTSEEQPLMFIQDTSGSFVYGFPGGGFTAGETATELYNPVNLFGAQPTRPGAPTTANPGGSPDPIVSENLLTGVTATIDDVVEKSAYVVEDGVTVLGSGNVELLIELPRTNPPPPFQLGEVVYGSTSGAVGEVVSQVTVEQEFDDDTPESVTSSSGGTATILAGSDTGSSLVVDGSISGTITGSGNIDCPAGSTDINDCTFPDGGDTIEGDLSGTVAEVIKVVSSDEGIPVTTRGTIAFTPTISGATNELDFCQGLRNAIVAAGDAATLGFVHTVNQDGIAINPAYLLVSGGVEDADGDGADGSFDQRNEITLIEDFESPARLRNDSGSSSAVYDDIVQATPMNVLAERLACARILGSVNALAVDATVQRNLAEVAFNVNEQALAVIELTWRGRELARLSLELQAAQLALSAAGLAITAYQAIADFEGVASIAAVSASIIDLANAISSLVNAVDAFDAADATYEGACESQIGTAEDLVDAIEAAEEALDLAIRADAWGGVR